MRRLLSANEAIARGAYESGVTVATGYPGTPSTEILENVVQYKGDIYCEWSPNEKVAFEVAAAAACAGARSIVTMKHVGLNVAADPLMTLSYIGVEGGMVIVVADDPGMHSSQNEQDTRHYARFAKIPLFEPSDSQEAKDFVGLAIRVSEEFKTPVILRTTTRVSHSRSLVELGERTANPKTIGLEKNPPRFVPVPLWGRPMRRKVEERLTQLKQVAAASPVNRVEWRDRSLGIVTHSIAYQYVREVWPEASVLKLGMAYPFPDALFSEFAAGVEKLLVVEELDDFLQEHIKALGIRCVGREFVPGIGELSVTVLQQSRAAMEGRQLAPIPAPKYAEELPARPPVLCPGCPHRGIFHALGKHDVIVTGDIGCYSLGTFKPLNRLDIILCMGGGVSMAHGLDKAGDPRTVVGIVGDSTFFHSGITGLLDIAYNKGCSTIIVVDNRTTAMTGHQENPGTGLTLMGESTVAASIEQIGRACGIQRVRTVNPYDSKQTEKVIAEEIHAKEPSLVVSRAPCPLREHKRVGPVRRIDPEKCKACKACLKLGCPAIDGAGAKPRIDGFLCNGCSLCEQVCRFGAITTTQEDAK
ncbi:MAG TPA: indolepyruvate ferredoxin oxidoreductase subunit alpha [Sedimentisphaerales bacterium]|nr:indolepyruvate ferredoxin oxidoreductase subunit alpha [Sedimentisphaerales bacterium]HNU28237.1 indolepyruvate ferredoxin oxidoreductase subunit alpha [Sedimentisphaerales bacterium]